MTVESMATYLLGTKWILSWAENQSSTWNLDPEPEWIFNLQKNDHSNNNVMIYLYNITLRLFIFDVYATLLGCAETDSPI